MSNVVTVNAAKLSVDAKRWLASLAGCDARGHVFVQGSKLAHDFCRTESCACVCEGAAAKSCTEREIAG